MENSSTRFVLWMNSRWREVNLDTGLIEGKRHKPRFVCLRNGQLHFVRRAKVLRGLRALAAGRPTTVFDGEPLEYRRMRNREPERLKRNKRNRDVGVGGKHSHSSNASNDVSPTRVNMDKSKSPAKVNAATQAGPSLRPWVKLNLVRGAPEPEARSKRDIVQDSNMDTEETAAAKPTLCNRISEESRKKLKAFKRSRWRREQEEKKAHAQQAGPSARAGAVGPVPPPPRKNATDDSKIETCRSTSKRRRVLADTTEGESSDDGVDLQSLRARVRGDNNSITELRPENIRATRLRSRDTPTKPDEGGAFTLREGRALRSSGSRNRSRNRSRSSSSGSMGEALAVRRARARGARSPQQFKELIVEEGDVRVLRRFLLRTNENFDARKFDTDDEYKHNVFYLINPLVYLERSREVERAQAALFAAGREPAAAPARRASTASSPRTNAGAPPPSTSTPEPRPRRVKAVAVESDASAPQEEAVSQYLLKEYSPREDQAIVAWVSNGGRAQHVNGNRVWRELEARYAAIAGRPRTWQSLRNRYLRHILPSLGALALEPSHAARLRAAAATGSMKKKPVQRRNSIFKPAERGASSRAPPRRPPPADTSGASASSASSDASDAENVAEEEAGGAPPRYSEVLRRFEARRRRTSGSSEVGGAGANKRSSPRIRGDRGRRLFNPNAAR